MSTLSVASQCPECSTPWVAEALSCPTCHRLVHKDALAELAKSASALEAVEPAEAARLWTRALALLPPGAKQRRIVQAKVDALLSASGAKPQKKGVPKWLAGTGAVGLLAWKFKAVALLILSKGKLLLLGLTKWKTALSMILALGVYWAAWGWPFALGFVLSIYVHEMGHVMALRHYGLPASAPMFIPGVGAFVRLHKNPETPQQDCRIGLAGPWAGLAAALFCYAVFLVTDAPIFAGLARVGAWINIFNLIPIWQLDGGRAFNAFDKKDRWYAAAVVLGMWYFTQQTMLLLVLLGAVFRAAVGKAPEEADRRGLLMYATLICLLGAMMTISVPGLPTP